MRVRRIPVSGAFHTRLMTPAKKPFENAFQDLKLGTTKVCHLNYKNELIFKLMSLQIISWNN